MSEMCLSFTKASVLCMRNFDDFIFYTRMDWQGPPSPMSESELLTDDIKGNDSDYERCVNFSLCFSHQCLSFIGLLR